MREILCRRYFYITGGNLSGYQIREEKQMHEKGICDIHCHIVPGVDDGAAGLDETRKLLRMEYNQGVRKIIATPHFRFDMFETPPEVLKEQFKLAEKAAAEISPELRIYMGCEIHSAMEMLPMLREKRIMTMAETRWVLVEFSGNAGESYIRERLSTLLCGGYKPIIAHIERCRPMRENLGFVADLVSMGAWMQINADSIIGKEGFFTGRYCRKAMKHDLIHFVGSDCHDSRKRIPRIGEAYKTVIKIMGQDYADELFIHNPERILSCNRI